MIAQKSKLRLTQEVTAALASQATRWLSWYGVGLASADRLPVVVRIPAGPLGSLKCDPPKGNGRRVPKKTAALASHSRDPPPHGGVFPYSIDREYLCGYGGDGYALLCGFVFPTMDLQSLSASGQQDTLSSDHQGPKDIAHTGYPLL